MSDTLYLKPPTPTRKAGTGSGGYHNPLRVVDLIDAWPELAGDIHLAAGEYDASDELHLPSGAVFKGAGMDKTTVRSHKGKGVIRGESENTQVSDMTLVCNDQGDVCNGWSPKGDHNKAIRVRVQNLFSTGEAEAFGFLPYGDHAMVSDCLVEDINSNYATAFCPLGLNPLFWRCDVVGNNGRRIMGYSLYANNGWYAGCRAQGVTFGFYGDTGGNKGDKDRSWGNTRIIDCQVQALEAAIQVQSTGQRFDNFFWHDCRFVSPRWANVFSAIKDGDKIHRDVEIASGFHWSECEFVGGPHLALAKVPGCTMAGGWFEQAPQLHKEHALPFLFWSSENNFQA